MKALFSSFFYGFQKTFKIKKWQTPLPFFVLLLLYIPSYFLQAETLRQLSDIQTIVQDEQGYIWLAGLQGLSRFDGENLTRFDGNSTNWKLPHTWINDITQENNTFIMATETGGLWKFHPSDGKTTPIPLQIENKQIYNIVQLADNYYFYTVSPNRLYQHSITQNKTKQLTSNIVITDLITTNKHVYFSTVEGLYKVDESSNVSLILKSPVSAIMSLPNGVIATSNHTLYYFDDKNNEQSIKIPEEVTAITNEHNSDNFFTISVKGSIKKYQLSDLSSIEHYYHNNDSTIINQLFHDKSNVLWLISSLGVQRLSQSNIKNYPIKFNVLENSLQLEKLNNQLIIGSYGGAGLHNFNEDEGIIPKNINQFFTTSGKRIFDLLTIDDAVFIATFDGLWKFNLLNKKLSRIDLFEKNTILLKLSYKNNKLYIGTDNKGLVIYDITNPTNNKFIDANTGISSNEVIDILPLDKGETWIATAAGLDIYTPFNNSVTKLPLASSSKVYSLALSHNKIFAATESNGIFVYNRQGELLSRFGSNIDFFEIKAIDNKVWASTSNGLYLINPTTNQISLIPNTENYSFTDSAVLYNDKLYIAHNGGVLEVPLVEKKQYHSKIYISKTTVSGQITIQNNAINIESPNDVIMFELASLDYRLGQQKKYEYQINGGLWHKINGNQLTLTGLAPGIYRIEIKGTNSLGQWSDYHAFTEIDVAYPWYWTPKVRVLYTVVIIALLALLFWLIYLRGKSISNIHQILSENLKLRGKSSFIVSRNLSHTIELIDENIAQLKENKTLTTLDNQEKIKLILTQSIEELSNHAKTKEPDALYGKTLFVALPFLTNYIHKKYHINVKSQLDIDENKLDYEIQADIYKITYEALTSSVLNGKGRNFNIVLQEFKNKIWLTISDDENSFTHFKSKINFDMAMYYIRQIAAKHNASVNTFSEPNKGSQLMVSFPLMNIRSHM